MSDGAVPHQFNSPSPFVALVPGVIAAAVGLHLVLADTAAWVGAVLLPIGVALLIIGAVAQGVAWGIPLERQNRES